MNQFYSFIFKDNFATVTGMLAFVGLLSSGVFIALEGIGFGVLFIVAWFVVSFSLLTLALYRFRQIPPHEIDRSVLKWRLGDLMIVNGPTKGLKGIPNTTYWIFEGITDEYYVVLSRPKDEDVEDHPESTVLKMAIQRTRPVQSKMTLQPWHVNSFNNVSRKEENPDPEFPKTGSYQKFINGHNND